jgi:hypothetical protein
MDDLVIPASPMPEYGLVDVLARYTDVAASVHIRDRALGHHVMHGPPNLLLVTTQKPRAVDRTLVTRVLAAIN